MSLWLANLSSSPAGSEGTAGFNLYSLNPTTLLKTLPASPLTYDLSSIFSNGEHTLGLSKFDIFGNESEIIQLLISVTGGEADTKVINPMNVRAIDKGNGDIEVRWLAVDYANLISEGQSELQSEPTDFQIADNDDLATILATVTFSSNTRSYRTTISGFADSEDVCLSVRSRRSGTGQEWITAPCVTVNITAPSISEIIV